MMYRVTHHNFDLELALTYNRQTGTIINLLFHNRILYLVNENRHKTANLEQLCHITIPEVGKP